MTDPNPDSALEIPQSDYLEGGDSIFIAAEMDEELVRNAEDIMLAIKAVIKFDMHEFGKRSMEEFYLELSKGENGLIARANRALDMPGTHVVYGLAKKNINGLRMTHYILERHIDFVTYVYKYMQLEGQSITAAGKVKGNLADYKRVPRFSFWLKSDDAKRCVNRITTFTGLSDEIDLLGLNVTEKQSRTVARQFLGLRNKGRNDEQ